MMCLRSRSRMRLCPSLLSLSLLSLSPLLFPPPNSPLFSLAFPLSPSRASNPTTCTLSVLPLPPHSRWHSDRVSHECLRVSGLFRQLLILLAAGVCERCIARGARSMRRMPSVPQIALPNSISHTRRASSTAAALGSAPSAAPPNTWTDHQRQHLPY